MQIYNESNKTKTGQILVTKSIGALIIASSLAFEALTNEQIKVEIERSNGSNFEITKGFMSLKDFILLTTYGDDAVTHGETYAFTAVCELSDNGSIHLSEKDVIRIEMQGLKTAQTYVINGIEEPITSFEIVSFEQKSMGAEETNKVFQVTGNDICVLDKDASIEEIAYGFDNGQTIKYTLFELSVLSRSVDPIAHIKPDGTVESCYSDKLQLPLLGVDTIEIRKSQGSTINLMLRKEA